MSKRIDEGPTLQEKKVPTPEHDHHKGRKKKSKGPYVVTASSFKFGNLPTYLFVKTEQGAQASKRQTYWKTFEIYGEGEGWDLKTAKQKFKELTNQFKERG
jgi:hypothetical protein